MDNVRFNCNKATANSVDNHHDSTIPNSSINSTGQSTPNQVNNGKVIRSYTLFDNRDFLPRPFQIELYEACKSRDTIVFLRPGNGKHFIIVMLVKYFTCNANGRTILFQENFERKKIFFLTKSSNSIRLYSSVFRAHTDFRIAEYFDYKTTTKTWSSEQWRTQIAAFDIHLMPDTLFEHLLNSGLVLLKHINLLILDDVHKILLNDEIDCYTRIVRKLQSIDSTNNSSNVTRNKSYHILGLSASILLEDVSSVVFRKMIEQIEQNLDCTCETYADLRMINKYSIQSRIKLRFYSSFTVKNILIDDMFNFKLSLFQLRNFTPQFFDFMRNLYDPKLTEQDHLVTNQMLSQAIIDVLHVYGTLGEWCTIRLIELYNREIVDTITLLKSTNSNYLNLLNSTYSTLQLIKQSVLAYLPDDISHKLESNPTSQKMSLKQFMSISSPKLHLLADILRNYLTELKSNTPGSNTTATTHSSFSFPSNICAIIYAEKRATVRILTMWIMELAAIISSDSGSKVNCFSYLQPEYVFLREDSSETKNYYYEKQQKSLHEIYYYRQQEEVLKRFRFAHNCNLLLTTSMSAEGLDINRCNMAICFDPPNSFQQFILSKGRVRVENGQFIVMVEEEALEKRSFNKNASYVSKFREFCEIEKIFTKLVPLNNDVLIENEVTVKSFLDTIHQDCSQLKVSSSSSIQPTVVGDQSKSANTSKSSIRAQHKCTGPNSGVQLTMENAISILNRYCLKLPSDTFTKLAPHYYIDSILRENGTKTIEYQCRLYLPINSTYRDEIVGETMTTKVLAKRSAALKAVQTLRDIGELDHNYYPIGKETNRYIEKLDLQDCFINTGKQTKETVPHRGSANTTNRYNRLQARNIASKRRQYYEKKVAQSLCGDIFKSISSVGQSSSDKVSESEKKYYIQHLYQFEMKLTCPLPEEQNNRGRKIVDPAETSRTFGIVTPNHLPPICDFTIYNRSGEVTVALRRLESATSPHGMEITETQMNSLCKFHGYLFENVLRLGKSSIQFDLHNASNGSYLVVPIESQQIDWNFVELIHQHASKSETEGTLYFDESLLRFDHNNRFVFDEALYRDAVIIPKYRRDKMQAFFYVAEICTDLTPLSSFPDAGFKTFEEYYRCKYSLEITNLEQPLLDVDHTSSRLNLLTPRFLNRKGITLPSSTTAKTKRVKKQNLQQKQILVPELCYIHPFPASFWRKAVCLPCILYRLNSLLIAEELRFKIAKEANIGVVDLPDGLSWPKLDFGWSLIVKQAIKLQEQSQQEETCQISQEQDSRQSPLLTVSSSNPEQTNQPVYNNDNTNVSSDTVDIEPTTAEPIAMNEDNQDDPFVSMGDWSSFANTIEVTDNVLPKIEIISGPYNQFAHDEDELNQEGFYYNLRPQTPEPNIYEIDDHGNPINVPLCLANDDDMEPPVRIGSPTQFSDSDDNDDDEDGDQKKCLDGFDLIDYYSIIDWTRTPSSCSETNSDSLKNFAEYDNNDKFDDGDLNENDNFEVDKKFILNIDELSKDISNFNLEDEEFVKEFYDDTEMDESLMVDSNQPKKDDKEKSHMSDMGDCDEYEDNGSYSDFDLDDLDEDEDICDLGEDDDIDDDDDDGVESGSYEYDDDDEDMFDEQMCGMKRSVNRKKSRKNCQNRSNVGRGGLRSCLNELGIDGYKTKGFLYDILRYELLYDCNQFEKRAKKLNEHFYRQKLGEETEKRKRKLFEDVYHVEKLQVLDCVQRTCAKLDENDIDDNNNSNSSSFVEYQPEKTVVQYDNSMDSFDISDTKRLIELLFDNFDEDCLCECSNEQANSHINKTSDQLMTLDCDEPSGLNHQVKQYSDQYMHNKSTTNSVAASAGVSNTSNEVKFGELLPNRDQAGLHSDSTQKQTNTLMKSNDSEENDGTSKSCTLYSPPSNTLGPHPSLILQAITMSNSSDGINLERLETVGDSFLKYSITAFLFCMCPDLNEGKLSFLRSRQISNINLHRLGQRINLGRLMIASKFEPYDNWSPPAYKVKEEFSVGNNKVDKNIIPYNLLTQHSIPNKSIADCVEALIGTYLISSGSLGAIQFMDWLGLKVLPKEMKLCFRNDPNECKKSNTEPQKYAQEKWLPIPKSPLIIPKHLEHDSDAIHAKLEDIYYKHQLNMFEQMLGYSFRDKAYLVQAFTHNSYYENTVTDCYQRLEFLGDAVLDYLITKYLYEDPQCHSPGTLTDLRSALVNNTFFASLAVKYNFHKYLMMLSFELYRVIDGFVRKFNLYNNGSNSSKNNTDGTSSAENEVAEDEIRFCSYWELFISENEAEHLEDIEVPKALGDIFESVAGAIYLDSGMSLDAVWSAYYPMMKPEIEYFSYNVPKSPIRVLLEKQPQSAKFGKPEITSGRKIRVCVEVFDVGKFVGVGRNKRIAKCTAAKRALRALKAIEMNRTAKEKAQTKLDSN